MASEFGFNTTAEEVAAHFKEQIVGKNVLVTGASPNSLGAEAARVIAKNGAAALVVLAGRTKANLEATEQAIKKETPSANIRLLEIDLVNLDSVRKAADEVNSYKEPIHVLINNAASMACPYRPAPKGLESQFWGNHVGHFLFTSRIFNKLVSSASATYTPRIVNVSSGGHARSPIIFDDMGFSGGEKYEPWNAYGQSKTANILFSRQLAKNFGGKLLAFSLHPGGIVTNLSRDLTPEAQETLRGMLPPNYKRKQLSNGTSTHIVAAFSPEIAEHNGAYLQDCQVDDENCKGWAKDMEAAERLWKITEELVEEKFAAGA